MKKKVMKVAIRVQALLREDDRDNDDQQSEVVESSDGAEDFWLNSSL